MRKNVTHTIRQGFTIVELLVVIGIIALLMSLLMPALSKARLSAQQIVCKSNMKQVGVALMDYMNRNNGWMFPAGPALPSGDPSTFGSNLPPHLRWPTIVFTREIKPPAVMPYTDDPVTHMPYVTDQLTMTDQALMAKYPAADYSPVPNILICPSDQQAYEAHSYVLNMHLPRQKIRFGAGQKKNVNSTDIIVMGEKKTVIRDYFMERDDFDRVVESYRHGLRLGSNYLYLDGHVETLRPNDAKGAIDPWDPAIVTTPVIPTP